MTDIGVARNLCWGLALATNRGYEEEVSRFPAD